MNNKANQLINSQSPYLLQHAHNPVNWYPWSPEALEKAQKENKPILVSIGYSACHWCHVMEKESFEDQETAELMNVHFIAIKIDREERPDLDNIYMDAVQSMGLQGGWPLNVFLMPDQKPFYGGTYFPNAQWKSLLQNIAEAYESHYDELAKSAEGFGRSINLKEREKYQLSEDSRALSPTDIRQMAEKIIDQTDPKWGGMNRAPKFPMPSIWNFLLHVGVVADDPKMIEKVLFTLDKIGMGGIYDHLAGGFARYSVDGEWFAPHFEKMLYDNGQLLSLYALAYQVSEKPMYLEKINETIQWLSDEMRQDEGGFYAALDADSEGEEGKFYTWTFEELESILGDDESWFFELYSISKKGNWEKGANILFQTIPYEAIARKYGFETPEFEAILAETKSRLLKLRNLRTKPGLDDKVLAGWNGLAITGLVKASVATGNIKARELALSNGDFILEKMIDGAQLYRAYKNGKAYTPGFLEDYAAVIRGFIHLYQLTFDQKWICHAKSLTDFTLQHFFDEEESLFYFNNPSSEKLIANKKEIFDNVIPSSNAIMAENLHLLGLYFYDEDYSGLSRKMISLMRQLLLSDPGYLSQWANTYLSLTIPTPEVAVIGKGAPAIAVRLQKEYAGKIVIAASEAPSDSLPLLAHKVADPNGNALIYVCFDKACRNPVRSVADAIHQFPKLV